MATKRLNRPTEIAVGRGPAEVRRRIGHVDAHATAKGACRAVSESQVAALPDEDAKLAAKAESIEGEDRG